MWVWLLPAGILLSPCVVTGQVASAGVNGVSLVYEIEGQGKPLVLIHGWAVHRGFWDGDMEAFARRYQVIRYDRRGCGESSGRVDYSADAADLKALLDLLGHSRVHVMGHSAGAGVALTFAVRYPEMVDGLVLFGTGRVEGFGLLPGAEAASRMEWVAAARAHGVDTLKALMTAS